MAVVWAVTWGRGQMDLVKVVEHSMNRIKARAVRIVLPAAVLIHEMVLRSVCAVWFAAKLTTGRAVPGPAIAIDALRRHGQQRGDEREEG